MEGPHRRSKRTLLFVFVFVCLFLGFWVRRLKTRKLLVSRLCEAIMVEKFIYTNNNEQKGKNLQKTLRLASLVPHAREQVEETCKMKW